MKIAMLAPISWRTPPAGYGPWELVTSLLTEGLHAAGIDVTLFATRDSHTAGRLAGVVPHAYSEDPTLDAKVWEALHIGHVFERAGEFDLIHNQADFVPLAFSRLVDTPLVTTIHGFSSERILPAYRAYDDRVHYVAISDADRHPALHYAATIHHGIRSDGLPVRRRGQRRPAVLWPYPPRQGRRRRDRGGAGDRAPADHGGAGAGRGLSRARGRAASGRAQVRHLGVVAGADRARTLGSAKALLHLIGFDEPFGLSVVEAMACGDAGDRL